MKASACWSSIQKIASLLMKKLRCRNLAEVFKIGKKYKESEEQKRPRD